MSKSNSVSTIQITKKVLSIKLGNSNITRCAVTRPGSNLFFCSDPVLTRPCKILAQSTTNFNTISVSIFITEIGERDQLILKWLIEQPFMVTSSENDRVSTESQLEQMNIAEERIFTTQFEIGPRYVLYH